MPPQIKHDLNRSGWETTDFPSVCERCLPDNPYVQMLKNDYSMECKICTRPFTLFTWKADRTSRQKRTNICLTCARLKNCCQCCMLDLSFGLPIVVRDQALKMIAPGPESSINREYYAQNNEKEIEEGRGGVEAYEKTDEKARELLRRLANSEPYYKKQRRLEAEQMEGQKALMAPEGSDGAKHTPGPIRSRDSKTAGARAIGRGGRGARPGQGRPMAAPQPEDWLPPPDPNITSLFITGVDDDLPEHEIRVFFAKFGQLRSVVCSHRSHCAFINFIKRDVAEQAAESLQGKAVIKGCPVRVQWGKPKPLDSLDHDQRLANARAGRQTARAVNSASRSGGASGAALSSAKDDLAGLAAIAPPPGADDEANYASLAGN